MAPHDNVTNVYTVYNNLAISGDWLVATGQVANQQITNCKVPIFSNMLLCLFFIFPSIHHKIQENCGQQSLKN